MKEAAASFTAKLKEKLDWSKLLGFNQANRSQSGQGAQRLTDPRMAKLGGKVGQKTGIKPQVKECASPAMLQLSGKLDWSKLLGFNQVNRAQSAQGAQRLTDPRMAKLGGKVGTKPGVKIVR